MSFTVLTVCDLFLANSVEIIRACLWLWKTIGDLGREKVGWPIIADLPEILNMLELAHTKSELNVRPIYPIT
jgi:hypothetical protein